ncbi:MAG: hypothetical protein QM741_13885 [Rudaea sp.]|uniref:hypothetical protein n=1 Tax=Rudaea sp. TaxID=2136325 RepID=UPI0039E25714
MKSHTALKVSLQQIADISGESIPVIYRAIEEGHLKTFLVGRRRFARYSAVEAWIDLLEKQSDSGRPVVYRSREYEQARRFERREPIAA